MELPRIIFITTISISVFVLSLLTAKVFAIGLNLNHRMQNIAMLAGLAFPILFIGNMILSRLSSGFFVRELTVATSIMGAIGFYLVGGAIILGICIIGAHIFKIPLAPWLGVAMFTISLVAAITGIIQTRIPVVKSYTVALENLPQELIGKKAVLISDTHYGLINYSGAAKRAVRLIQQQNPDFVLVAGDLFDGPAIDADQALAPWAALTATTPVFYAPGNHEEYGPYGAFIEATKNIGFTVLTDSTTNYQGLTIAGITYRSKNRESEIPPIFETMNLEKSSPSILINHPPTFMKAADDFGFDLMVSGHTHRGQFWPIRYITKAIYGKYYYGKQTYNNLTTVTTGGFGFAGIPSRFINPPEIVELTLTAK